MSTNYNTIDYLESLFPAQVFIRAIAAGRVLGWADQTTRNQIYEKKFPIPTVLLGGQRVVKKIDLANFIDGFGGEQKKRGRPTKASKIEAAKQAGGAK